MAGRRTGYRRASLVIPGIETARRLAPGSVVERARALLDSGTRNLADLMLELESARAELQERAESRLPHGRWRTVRTLTHKLTRLEARRKGLERR